METEPITTIILSCLKASFICDCQMKRFQWSVAWCSKE